MLCQSIIMQIMRLEVWLQTNSRPPTGSQDRCFFLSLAALHPHTLFWSCYGLLLTSLCSRAIYIEMIDDVTVDAFINALRAFITIKGNVRQLRCDQGTNFVAARSQFCCTTLKRNGSRKGEGSRMWTSHESPSCKSRGWGLGKTDQNNKKCSYCHSRPVSTKAWQQLS